MNSSTGINSATINWINQWAKSTVVVPKCVNQRETMDTNVYILDILGCMNINLAQFPPNEYDFAMEFFLFDYKNCEFFGYSNNEKYIGNVIDNRSIEFHGVCVLPCNINSSFVRIVGELAAFPKNQNEPISLGWFLLPIHSASKYPITSIPSTRTRLLTGTPRMLLCTPINTQSDLEALSGAIEVHYKYFELSSAKIQGESSEQASLVNSRIESLSKQVKAQYPVNCLITWSNLYQEQAPHYFEYSNLPFLLQMAKGNLQQERVSQLTQLIPLRSFQLDLTHLTLLTSTQWYSNLKTSIETICETLRGDALGTLSLSLSPLLAGVGLHNGYKYISHPRDNPIQLTKSTEAFVPFHLSQEASANNPSPPVDTSTVTYVGKAKEIRFSQIPLSESVSAIVEIYIKVNANLPVENALSVLLERSLASMGREVGRGTIGRTGEGQSLILCIGWVCLPLLNADWYANKGRHGDRGVRDKQASLESSETTEGNDKFVSQSTVLHGPGYNFDGYEVLGPCTQESLQMTIGVQSLELADTIALEQLPSVFETPRHHFSYEKNLLMKSTRPGQKSQNAEGKDARDGSPLQSPFEEDKIEKSTSRTRMKSFQHNATHNMSMSFDEEEYKSPLANSFHSSKFSFSNRNTYQTGAAPPFAAAQTPYGNDFGVSSPTIPSVANTSFNLTQSNKRMSSRIGVLHPDHPIAANLSPIREYQESPSRLSLGSPHLPSSLSPRVTSNSPPLLSSASPPLLSSTSLSQPLQTTYSSTHLAGTTSTNFHNREALPDTAFSQLISQSPSLLHKTLNSPFEADLSAPRDPQNAVLTSISGFLPPHQDIEWPLELSDPLQNDEVHFSFLSFVPRSPALLSSLHFPSSISEIDPKIDFLQKKDALMLKTSLHFAMKFFVFPLMRTSGASVSFAPYADTFRQGTPQLLLSKEGEPITLSFYVNGGGYSLNPSESSLPGDRVGGYRRISRLEEKKGETSYKNVITECGTIENLQSTAVYREKKGKQRGEIDQNVHIELCRYMYGRCAEIEVWDEGRKDRIGSCFIPLTGLIRQKKKMVRETYTYPVFDAYTGDIIAEVTVLSTCIGRGTEKREERRMEERRGDLGGQGTQGGNLMTRIRPSRLGKQLEINLLHSLTNRGSDRWLPGGEGAEGGERERMTQMILSLTKKGIHLDEMTMRNMITNDTNALITLLRESESSTSLEQTYHHVKMMAQSGLLPALTNPLIQTRGSRRGKGDTGELGDIGEIWDKQNQQETWSHLMRSSKIRETRKNDLIKTVIDAFNVDEIVISPSNGVSFFFALSFHSIFDKEVEYLMEISHSQKPATQESGRYTYTIDSPLSPLQTSPLIPTSHLSSTLASSSPLTSPTTHPLPVVTTVLPEVSGEVTSMEYEKLIQPLLQPELTAVNDAGEWREGILRQGGIVSNSGADQVLQTILHENQLIRNTASHCCVHCSLRGSDDIGEGKWDTTRYGKGETMDRKRGEQCSTCRDRDHVSRYGFPVPNFDTLQAANHRIDGTSQQYYMVLRPHEHVFLPLKFFSVALDPPSSHLEYSLQGVSANNNATNDISPFLSSSPSINTTVVSPNEETVNRSHMALSDALHHYNSRQDHYARTITVLFRALGSQQVLKKVLIRVKPRPVVIDSTIRLFAEENSSILKKLTVSFPIYAPIQSMLSSPPKTSTFVSQKALSTLKGELSLKTEKTEKTETIRKKKTSYVVFTNPGIHVEARERRSDEYGGDWVSPHGAAFATIELIITCHATNIHDMNKNCMLYVFHHGKPFSAAFTCRLEIETIRREAVLLPLGKTSIKRLSLPGRLFDWNRHGGERGVRIISGDQWLCRIGGERDDRDGREGRERRDKAGEIIILQDREDRALNTEFSLHISPYQTTTQYCRVHALDIQTGKKVASWVLQVDSTSSDHKKDSFDKATRSICPLYVTIGEVSMRKVTVKNPLNYDANFSIRSSCPLLVIPQDSAIRIPANAYYDLPVFINAGEISQVLSSGLSKEANTPFSSVFTLIQAQSQISEASLSLPLTNTSSNRLRGAQPAPMEVYIFSQCQQNDHTDLYLLRIFCTQ